jgi:hypothetical protein
MACDLPILGQDEQREDDCIMKRTVCFPFLQVLYTVRSLVMLLYAEYYFQTQ